MRRSVLLAVAATLASVLSAAAPAGATTCNLLVDPVGDGKIQAVPTALAAATPASPELDIVSGDVASGATTVVGVLRLRSLTPDPVTTFGGVTWHLSFRLGATNYAFTARRPSNGTTYHATLAGKGTTTTTTYPAFAVDATAGTLTWTAPRASFPALAAPGQTFSDIHAGSGVAGTNADAAWTTATYLDHTPSCVAAG